MPYRIRHADYLVPLVGHWSSPVARATPMLTSGERCCTPSNRLLPPSIRLSSRFSRLARCSSSISLTRSLSRLSRTFSFNRYRTSGLRTRLSCLAERGNYRDERVATSCLSAFPNFPSFEFENRAAVNTLQQFGGKLRVQRVR